MSLMKPTDFSSQVLNSFSCPDPVLPLVVLPKEGPWSAGELLFWFGEAFFWALVLASQYVVLIPSFSPDLPASTVYLILAVRLATGVNSTLFLRWLYHWLIIKKFSVGRLLFTAILGLFLTAAVELAVFRPIVLFLITFVSPTHPYNFDNIPLYYAFRVQILLMWSLCYVAFIQIKKVRNAEVKAAQAETALRSSELDRLEAHLQPHFLFNAMTAVLACRHDPDAVARVTVGLSEYLRFCLSRQATLEPLAREISALEHLIVVQRVRFGSNLDCEVQCTPEASLAMAPPMLLGPLIDNALKYGAQTSDGKLSIKVDCRIENTVLLLTVFNTGNWVQPGSTGRRGTGIENQLSRLRLLGLETAQLGWTESALGVLVQLRVPLNVSGHQNQTLKPGQQSSGTTFSSFRQA